LTVVNNHPENPRHVVAPSAFTISESQLSAAFEHIGRGTSLDHVTPSAASAPTTGAVPPAVLEVAMKMIRCALPVLAVLLAATVSAQTPASIADQVKSSANPELIGALTKEMGATVPQASGAAGALFGLAKTKLKPEEFSKVAGAVPGMDALLAAAPAVAGTSGSAVSAASKLAGGSSALGGLAAVAPAFDKLGLKPEMAMKAVPILTNYVTKTGGKEVASLLAGALK
jgi:hypothetical protein